MTSFEGISPWLPGILLSLVVALGGASCSSSHPVLQGRTLDLSEDWQLQASSKVSEGGAQLSRAGASTDGWYSTRVPRTVLAALMDNGEYPDAFSGTRLENIPRDRFQEPWWYRRVFRISDVDSDVRVRLLFNGINYRANIWLNGVQIADTQRALGAFRRFDFDVTGTIRSGDNVLAVEVFPPRPGDFTIGFVDWNPRPPDNNMGLWRGVQLRFTGPLSIENPFVETKLNLETLTEADLTIHAELVNHDSQPVQGRLTLQIDDIKLETGYHLEGGETRQLKLDPSAFPSLHILDPKLWWPNGLGDPNLHSLRLTAERDGAVLDSRETRFGIREVGDYLNEQGYRGYTVNGKKVLIRGGGWVDDLLLRDDRPRIEAQMQYARDMRLNTIRLEGFWGNSEDLYDLADAYGLLVMVGWSCQWEWESYLGKPTDDFGGIRNPQEIRLITDSLADQVLWLRNHPGIFVWVLGSDMLPRPELEESYLSRLAEIDPTRPTLSSCSTRTSAVTGPSAVKMNGPYDYVTPNYWYLDTRHGGAYGFNTETGPGPQPPPISSIRRMLPPDHLWPIDEVWDYHCGRNEFNTLSRYLNAFDHRYGAAHDVEDFARWAQVANYEAIRAMFESFSVHKPVSTGVIQWMLNSAWPEMYWQLYDWYLMPNGAYFGTKAACQPANLVYDYGDGSIVAVNDTPRDRSGLKAEVRVLNLDSREVLAREIEVDLPANSSQPIFDDFPARGLSPVYFLSLRLTDGQGRLIARNFYWLSRKPDVLDFEHSQWFVTPNRSFADFRALRRLPAVELKTTSFVSEAEGAKMLVAQIENPSDKLAFFVELQVVNRQSGEPVLPILWEDNYISLLPGESRSIKAIFPVAGLRGGEPVLRVTGPNVGKQVPSS